MSTLGGRLVPLLAYQVPVLVGDMFRQVRICDSATHAQP